MNAKSLASAGRGATALLQQWGKDLQLWVFIVLTLQLFRLLLITVFRIQANEFGMGDILMVMGNGLRFDISTAAMWVAPTFLLGFLILFLRCGALLNRLRIAVTWVYVIVATLIFGTDLIFFDEYADQFNQMIFGIAYDDTKAILITIWKEYHPLWFLGISLPVIGLHLWLAHRWLDFTHQGLSSTVVGINSIWKRSALIMLGLLVFISAARGGTLWGEPIRLKHAFVVNDLFLNRTVVNPFSALRYTIKEKMALSKSNGLATLWPKKSINQALDEVLAERSVHAKGGEKSLDQLLSTRAKGINGKPPRHVFMVLMESHSGWTVMPQYRDVGLAPYLSSLADGGIYFPNFIATGSGTIGSMNAIITGLPDAGLNINYEVESHKAYPSAIAAVFKQLGYRTRFFYGGFLSWQRLDTFAQSQGFDELYGGGSMSAGVSTNEWGVDDQYLFDFVLNKVEDDTPSFNFILTTSNHPPYDLDLDALGYPLKALPAPLKATKEETVKVLGHLWYAEQQAGRFVEKAEIRFPHSLFALTGDHTARLQVRFPGDSVAEQVAVPFILYGPEVLPQSGITLPTAGSHIDIPPTLFELAAPEGFRYTAFGKDMLSKSSPSYGLGHEFIIGEDAIATLNEEPKAYALAGRDEPLNPADAKVVQQQKALQALGWYRVRKGAQLP